MARQTRNKTTGITTPYVRAAQAAGEFQTSLYDAMSFEDDALTTAKAWELKKDAKTENRNTGMQMLQLADNVINEQEEKREFEDAVAEYEVGTGTRLNYQSTSFLDALSGKGTFKDYLSGNVDMKAGGNTITRAEIEAYKLKRDAIAPEDKVNLGEASGWKFGQNTIAIPGSQRQGFELAELMNPESASIVGEMIYNKDTGGQGLEAWSTKREVLSDLMNSEENTNMQWFSKEEISDFNTQRAIFENEGTSDRNKKKASDKIQKYYAMVQPGRVEWDDLKGFIAARESKTPYDIYKNQKELGNVNSGGFDIGLYQINSKFVLSGEGTWEKQAAPKGQEDMAWEDRIDYKLYSDINAYLSDRVKNYKVQHDTSYYGNRKGFITKDGIDWSDLFGHDEEGKSNSIFKKYRNREDLNPYQESDKDMKRKQALMDAGLINENWETF
jgi:hypothetical protein|tara:strand:- start:14942 stop:16267 length:1326 start_codon:yes stop_codon:yes gene_type:complete